jgi:hypothetical protein
LWFHIGGEGVLKVCKKCGLPKPKTEFYGHIHTFDRLRPECKACCIIARDKHRRANIDKHRARQRAYTKRHKVKQRRNDYERLRRLRKRISQGRSDNGEA